MEYAFGESVETALRFYYQNAHEFHNGARLPVEKVVGCKIHECVFPEDWRQTHHQTRFVEFRHGGGSNHLTALQLESWSNCGPDGRDGGLENFRFGLGGDWRVVQVGVSKGFGNDKNKFFEAYPRFNCGNFEQRDFSLLRAALQKAEEQKKPPEELRRILVDMSATFGKRILAACHDIWIKRLTGYEEDAAVI